MDWKVFLATFSAVFFAELADKTQLVGIGMASKTANPVSVLAGSVSAYLIITAVSVFVGSLLGKSLRPEYLRYGSSFLFVLLGILIFFEKI